MARGDHLRGHKPEGSGRKKGQVNKTTADVRHAIATIVGHSIGDFQKWLAEIKDPKEKCDVLLRLMAFNVPKLAQVQSVVTVKRDVQDFTDEELAALASTRAAHAAAAGESGGERRLN